MIDAPIDVSTDVVCGLSIAGRSIAGQDPRSTHDRCLDPCCVRTVDRRVDDCRARSKEHWGSAEPHPGKPLFLVIVPLLYVPLLLLLILLLLLLLLLLGAATTVGHCHVGC